MKYWFLIPLIPIYIALNLFLFSCIASMLSAPSDMAVIVGVLLLCVMVAGNVFLITYLIKKFK